MRDYEDGGSPRCTSPLGQPNPFPTDPAPDASLRPNRISASFCPRDDFPPPLEIVRRIYLFLFFPTPNFLLAITILLRHDHFHTTAFLRILLFLRGRKNFVQVLMNLTPSSERFAFCFIKHRILQTACNGVHGGVV